MDVRLLHEAQQKHGHTAGHCSERRANHSHHKRLKFTWPSRRFDFLRMQLDSGIDQNPYLIGKQRLGRLELGVSRTLAVCAVFNRISVPPSQQDALLAPQRVGLEELGMPLENRLPFLAFGKLDRRSIELFVGQFFARLKFGNPAIEGTRRTVGHSQNLERLNDIRQTILFQIAMIRHHALPRPDAGQGIMFRGGERYQPIRR